ncbi:N-acetylmuramate alpha-1-phosphate uridylyltransferase MurU [Sulfurimonas sp.]|uniref:N-acetylmuramate alpha-1-phosphate uridylyltransferase MurU n=1 Tax=Sulfurimonas sp. TaxID=2022749 RepID=UPI003D11571A
MKAMILAAGRGERMRPLTDTIPKPLLKVGGKELIVWHIEKLARNGFKEIVINIAHLGEKIPEALWNGSRWGVTITYSDERDTGALETAGGIKKALEYLGDEPFLVINGDVYCDYEFDPNFDLQNKLAHLILVPNPPHNNQGDIGLENSLVLNHSQEMWTFSGIAYYNPKIFDDVTLEKLPLAPLLRKFIEEKKISGEVFRGFFKDIGTPQRLDEINEILHTI